MASTSSRSDLMDEYHRLAADTLLGAESNKVAVAILQAAEGGELERLVKLLTEHRDLVDARHPDSGDTPLISAARSGHKDVVDVLLGCGADVTLENDSGDSVLDVAGDRLRRHILKSISHEDRSMSNAKALLRSAWLGDSVRLRRCLSGSHYLDVNNRNSDGLTPLLLVTRDVSFFSKVQTAMETEYNPVEVLEQLLNNHADVNQADSQGQGPLHLIASSGPSIHATKMVSLLLQHGSATDALSSTSQSPLHVASSHGHMTIIVALVEEGGAHINLQTSQTGETPLILSVREGHNEAARYLLSKGADVTMVNDSGDSALTVANSPRMKRMIKEAWTEQTEQAAAMATKSDSDVTSPLSPGKLDNKHSFFLTDRQMSRSLDFDEHQLTNPDDRGREYSGGRSPLALDSPGQLAGERRRGSRDTSCDMSEAREGEGGCVVSEGEGKAGREKRGTRQKSKMKRRVQSESVLVDHLTGEPAGSGRSSRLDLRSTHPVDNTRQRAMSTDEQSGTRGPVWVSAAGRKIAGGDDRGRQAGDKERQTKKTTSKTSAASRKKPSRLLSQTKKESHDSHMTTKKALRDGHVISNRPQSRAPQLGRDQQRLPPVYTYSSPPAPKLAGSSRSQEDGSRLPHLNLRGMKVVRVMSVDTKQDNLRVRQVPRTTGSESPLQRSRSLMASASGDNKPKSLGQKRNSTGSIYQYPPPDQNKGALQPRLVAQQVLSFPSHHPSSHPVPPSPRHPPPLGTQKRLQATTPATNNPTLQSQGNRININFPTSQKNRNPQPLPPPPPLQPKLSVVVELSESIGSSTHFDHTLLNSTPSDHALIDSTPGSEGSTLKASSQSEFETDSLERRNTPTLTTPPQSHAPYSARPHPVQSPLSPRSALPPTVEQLYQLTRQPSSPAPSSNTVTNYAAVSGSTPLSPIWNLDLPQSRSSSDSDYIISALADGPSPLPGLRSNPRAAPGLDSGHSTDEERVEEEEEEGGSSESSSEAESVGVDIRSLQWKRGRLLGKGAFGKVWEGLLDSAQMIAVKEVELDIVGQKAQSQYEKLRLEVEILRSVKHRNVVRYLGTSMDDGHVYIFMDLIPGGSLLSILKRFGPLSDMICSRYTRQIVRALKYLHSNGIVHRDIKGANVMVTQNGVIKLIDFGSAKQEVAGDLISVRGTPYWMAPEVIRGEGHGRKSDIWSLGCTVHEMATSKPPWADHPPETAIFQIGIGTPIPPLPDRLSSDLISFIHRCMTRDPVQRPGADQLLKDHFLNKFKKRKAS